MLDTTMDRTIKKCTRCSLVQPIDQFAKNGINRLNGRQMYHACCKPCWQQYKRQRRLEGPKGRRKATTKCTTCSVELTEKNRCVSGRSVYTGKINYNSVCRLCRNANKRKYREGSYNPKAAKNTMLQWHYGMTLQEYEVLLATQGGKCAVCGGSEPTNDYRTERPRSLAVDHCHVSGEVRGLLCSTCNRTLGLLGESIARTKALLAYMERRNCCTTHQ